MKKSKIIPCIGILLFIISIIQVLILKQAHYYILFSIGALIILSQIYNKISKQKLFQSWTKKQFSLFLIILLITCIIIDKIGISSGYWIYPLYNTLFDEILKFPFEWLVPFLYLMYSMLIGQKIFEKYNFKKTTSLILGLIIFTTIAGIITEAFNIQIFSWKILSMPISNIKIGEFFIIFQTIGYWLMAIIPYILYKLIGRVKWL